MPSRATPSTRPTAATSSTSPPSPGFEGQAYSAGYCAAKHGLIGLTRALAVEYTADRLRVNAVCPGGMMTPQIEKFSAPEGADFT